MTEEEKLKRAKRQVAAMTGFYVHLTCFLAVMALLLFINSMGSSGWWVQWPFAGWGAFVLIHGVMVFGQVSEAIRSWQLKKTRELSDRM
jgi:hypothetical protein